MPETQRCTEQVVIRRDGQLRVVTCTDHGLGHYSPEYDLSWPAGDGPLVTVAEDPRA